MFEIGDIVRIHYHGNIELTDGCEAINLDGTIAEITSKQKIGFSMTKDNYKYNLRFIELKAKDMSRYDDFQQNCTWQDRHLELVRTKYGEIDLDELFKESV